MKKKEYQPISCDYVDYIEHLATKKEKVTIQYMDNLKIRTEFDDYIITWKNEAGIEYMYTQSGLQIRFDYIVAINGISPGEDCKL